MSSAAIYPLDGVEFDFNNFAPIDTWRIYKQNQTLYKDNGTTVSSISTGWNEEAPMRYFGLPGALVHALVAFQGSGDKRSVLRVTVAATTMLEENFDLVASTGVGVTVASSATAGALVAGNTHLVYIVLLNANTGRQSGPIGPFSVTIAAGQTSYDINTLPAAPADTQYTHFKLYRTQANLTVPFFSQQYAIAAAGTLVNDGVADAALTFTDPLPQSAFGDYFVGVPPGTIRLGITYRTMILSFGGGKMYWTEPGSNHRWSALYAYQFPITGVDITAAVEGDSGLVVATGREVFVGTGTGVYTGTPPLNDWQFTKITDEYGVYNPKCLLAVGKSIFGLGARGLFVIDAGGVRPIKKVVRDGRLQTPEYYYDPKNEGGNVPALGYDPAHRMLWAVMPMKGTWNSKQAPPCVTAVVPIDETGKVGWFDQTAVSFFPSGGRQNFGPTGGSDPSRVMLAGDSYGNVLELEYGENAGGATDDTTAYVVATAGGGSPGVSATITASGMGAAQLPARGVRVVGLPNDHSKDPRVGTVTANNGVDTFTIVDWGTDCAVPGTTFYIGGILGWYETGAMNFEGHEDGGIGAAVMNAVNLYVHDLVYEESDVLTSSNQPHVIAQMKVDGGNWGTRVTVYDGSAYPEPGKVAANLMGKSEASGRSKGGVTFRLRFFVVVAGKPARLYAFEPGVSDAMRPKQGGS